MGDHSIGNMENGLFENVDDPFAKPDANEPRRASHRYSAFDSHSFAQNQSSASPSSAKRALEAHLQETDRRLEEASKLGTSLVNQRSKISDRLKEVEQLQNDQEMGPELKQKLVNIEREYNELGRDSLRVSMAPKGRSAGTEDLMNGHNAPSGRPASPTKLSNLAVDSPSKMSSPSRKQRNQPTSSVHDIEFVTDISTSLLGQVRHLQAVLAERDDSIKSLSNEKGQMELEFKGLTQRLKTLDESEQRYKDENWSLETQTHELMASTKDYATREQKLQQGLTAANSEKLAAQRELDEVKQALGKLSEDHGLSRKHHESEIAVLRKNASSAESGRDALQRKNDELTSQNEELAKAIAGRYQTEEERATEQALPAPDDLSFEPSDPDHSPPPSPQKGPARNTVLESETLKSSLQHAHRMIVNLKNGIQRERTEKLDLKRLLQDSRDELEARRNDAGTSGSLKGNKAKTQQNAARKMPKQGQLGATRAGRLVIEDDPDWEERLEDDGTSPRLHTTPGVSAKSENGSEAYQTAAETDAFETANERESATETEAFQTGVESLAGDSSGDITETETRPGGKVSSRASRVPSMPVVKRHHSFLSTASASDEDVDMEGHTESHTSGRLSGKSQLRSSRGSRRSRVESQRFDDTSSSLKSSAVGSTGTPQGPGQTLAAELGFSDDQDEGFDGTPSQTRDSTVSPESVRTAPGAEAPGLRDRLDNTLSKVRGSLFSSKSIRARETASNPKRPSPHTFDVGMMTDPWDPSVEVSTVANDTTPPKDSVGAATNQTEVDNLRNVDWSSRMFEKVEDPASDLRPTQGEGNETLHPPGPSNTSILSSPTLNFSDIQSVEIMPMPSTPQNRAVGDAASGPEDAIQKAGSGKGGILGSVLGWAVGSKAEPLGSAQDEKWESLSGAEVKQAKEVQPRELEAQDHLLRSDDTPKRKQDVIPSVADQSSQTALSAAQIERLLSLKDQRASLVVSPSGSNPTKARSASVSNSKDLAQLNAAGMSRASLSRDQPPTKNRRPASSGNQRAANGDMPPLPADHRQAIAAAQQTPSKDKADGSMGPPATPASANRQTSRWSQTPQEQNMQTPGSATPRARYSTARSMRSRRSSVSSFESEIDARFNIRADGMPAARGMEGSTDPRMIQAITQTMIGEYLWKYTRKAGRGEMSDKRHRRFFWVHPYTRTLYWSDSDPSQAGRAQLKAKSVAIEAVRVVVDDNPMPPGLHRKSLLVITPGRDVKFTATTGQRHETWFNALSYLLLRSGLEYGDTGLTPEEMAEFNPAALGGSSVRASRISLASLQSRSRMGGISARGPPARSHSRTSSRDPSPSRPGSVVRGSIPAVPHANAGGSAAGRYSRPSSSLSSRLGNYWRPGPRQSRSRLSGSVAGGDRTSHASGSGYSASVQNDSAEDVRQVLEKQERDSDRLENVRACCDGKRNDDFEVTS